MYVAPNWIEVQDYAKSIGVAGRYYGHIFSLSIYAGAHNNYDCLRSVGLARLASLACCLLDVHSSKVIIEGGRKGGAQKPKGVHNNRRGAQHHTMTL